MTPITPPTTEGILKAFSSIKEVTCLDIGGFKAVFEAKIGKTWEALKIIEIPKVPDNPLEDDEIRKAEICARTFREIDILGQIAAPQLVKLGSLKRCEKVIDSRDFIAYSEELIAGEDLMKIVLANGEKPSEKESRTLFVTLLKAVRALWAKGIIHRDIKPANIMRTSTPKRPFVLMDLGIAYSLNDTGITNNTANVPATLKYVAPEMLRRGFRKSLNYRCDLYAAALTVYEYAAFRHPLSRSRDDIGTTLYNALNKKPQSLKSHRQDLSDLLCSMVDQMLRKEPALRPSNIDGMISQLGGKA